MNRRDFATRLGLAGTAAFVSPQVLAQGAPAEGRDYVRLPQPAPVAAPAGKVEVVEFFGYWCPHCNAFEPMLEAWVKRLSAHVAFRRVPVSFLMNAEFHQKLFFSLEAMGQLEAVHRKVFTAIHVERQRLEKPEEIGEFVAKHGIDRSRFLDALNSFSVVGKAKQASSLAAGYKIEGTPSIGVDGRWLTSGSMAGSNDRSLTVAEFLIGEAKRRI